MTSENIRLFLYRVAGINPGRVVAFQTIDVLESGIHHSGTMRRGVARISEKPGWRYGYNKKALLFLKSGEPRL